MSSDGTVFGGLWKVSCWWEAILFCMLKEKAYDVCHMENRYFKKTTGEKYNSFTAIKNYCQTKMHCERKLVKIPMSLISRFFLRTIISIEI